MVKQRKNATGQTSGDGSPKKATQNASTTVSKPTPAPSNLSTTKMFIATFMSLIAFGGIWAAALYGGKQFHNHVHTQEIQLMKNLAAHPGTLLLAQGRSGSSFLGSWFQATPKFLYFVEPCALPYTGKRISTNGEECSKIINELMKCDFSSVNPYDTHRQRTGHEEFEGWGNKTSIESCKGQARFIKEIRLGPWGYANGLDFPIRKIVLLRDPRAIWASRMKAWPVKVDDNESIEKLKANTPVGFNPATAKGHPYTQSIASVCYEQREFIKAQEKEGKLLLHLVHYIDLLRKPLETAQGVFGFMYIPMPKEVVEHIEKHTTGDCKFEGKTFSTCRNTKEKGKALKDNKWEGELNAEVLAMINEQCADIIEYHEERNAADLKEEEEAAVRAAEHEAEAEA